MDSAQYDLEVLQGHIALHFGQKDFTVGDPASLRQQFGDKFDQCYQQPLRTILRHRFSTTVEPDKLPAVTDENVLEDIGATIIGESPLAYAGNSSVYNKTPNGASMI